MLKYIQLKQVIIIAVAFFLTTAIEAQQCRLVIDENFNQYSGSYRNYTENMVRGDFGSIATPKGLDGRTKVGNGQIRALFPKDEILGGATGFTWFDRLQNNSTEEAVMQYRMKFSEGFQFTRGGKLPGLTGGTAPRGCNPDKKGGFSARQMWQRGGKMISYLYWPESDFRCGATWLWKDQNGNDLVMDTDRWYTIRQHIKLNRPGVRNGILEVFVDGLLVFKRTDIMFRERGDNFKIDNAYWTTYVGGSTQIFAPTQDQYIWFDDFKVWINCSTPPGTTTNQDPTVSITSPADGAVFDLGQTINLGANASDPDGNLDKVNFKINDAYYSTDNTRPFEGSFTPTEAGTYKIAARAFDRDNAQREVFVTVTVREPNRPPAVAITSPADGAEFDLGDEIALLANASDPDGNLDKVNFKINDAYYSTDNTRPFEGSFTPTEAGTYKIAARAFDADNEQIEVFITVTVKEPNSPPVISIMSPADGAVYEMGQEITLSANASDPDGNLERVNFFVNDEMERSDAERPFLHTFNPTEPGTYTIRARAIDRENLRTDASVTITVLEANLPPIASFSTPTESILQEGYPELIVTVEASDPNDDAFSVMLKINGQEVRSESIAPYEWGHEGSPYPSETVGLPAGDHVLEAVVTDERGMLTTISKTITVDRITSNWSLVGGSQISVFPNPSESGVFNLSEPSDFEVYNVTGSSTLTGSGEVVDLSSSPKGLYFLKVNEVVYQIMLQH